MDKQAYLDAVAIASPVGLVVINFEVLAGFLRAAQGCPAGSAEFRGNIAKAKDALDALIGALDFSVPLSHNFHALYTYAYGRLSEVHFSQGDNAQEAISECLEIVEPLLDSWRKVDEAAPPAPAGPVVYSGLTYGRDGKKEDYTQDESGGFLA
jgi:flagellin-specific chaperone FliS